MNNRPQRVFVFLSLLMLIAVSFYVAQLQSVIIVFPCLFIFCLPGWYVVRLWETSERLNFILLLAVSSIIGFTISTLFAILILWINPNIHIAALLFPLLLSVILNYCRKSKPMHYNRVSWSEMIVLVLILIAVLTFVVPPLANIGYTFPEGRAYRAYFNVDYLKHVAVTAHLAHSQIPPDNPYILSGGSFHYYWMYYVFPAAVTALPFADTSTLDVLRILNLWIIFVFTSLIFSLLQRLTKNLVSTSICIICCIFAYSYEGLYVLFKIYRQGKPLLLGLSEYNVDAVTRWFIGHPQVDGLYRTLIYTPQHLFALGFLIVIIFFVSKVFQEEEPSRINLWSAGLMTSLVFGFSSFIGMAACFWLGSLGFIFSVIKRKFSFFVHIIISMGIPFLLFFYLGIFFMRPGSLLIQPQLSVLIKLPQFLILNFGPVLLLFPIGIYYGLKKDRFLTNSFLLLTLICLILVLFFQVSGFPSDIGLKLGIIIAVTCMFIGAFGFESHRLKNPLFISLLASILICPALPTIVIDKWNSCDLQNTRFTSLIEWEDLKACDWIRKNTNVNARIQSEPFQRGVAFSLIPTFAERRTALGDKMHSRIFLSEPKRFNSLKKKVDELFRVSDPKVTQSIERQLKIDYVFIGSTERRIYGESLDKFKNFVCVYRKNSVEIFSDKLIADLSFSKRISGIFMAGDQVTLPFDLKSNDPELSHHYEMEVDLFNSVYPAGITLETKRIFLGKGEVKTSGLKFEIPEYDKQGESYVSCRLFHILDQSDIELKNNFSIVDFHRLCHTTGEIACQNGEEFVTVSKGCTGLVACGSLGLLPAGSYGITFEKLACKTPCKNVYIRILSSKNDRIIAEFPLEMDVKTGLFNTVYFNLDDYQLITLKIISNSKASFRLKSCKLEWKSKARLPIPIQIIKLPIKLHN